MLALLGMLLVLPTINVGLIGDDYIVNELLTGQAHRSHPGTFFDLFTFAKGTPGEVDAGRASGLYTWWVADNARLSFWRPVSELAHWLDYQLWPQSPTMMHVHSVLWYGLLVWLLGRFYRMLDADPLRSGLATLVFAVSTVHLFTLVWLAARNQLISSCLLLMTLMCYHQWRQGRGRHFALLAMLTLTVDLLSAEAAMGAMGYLMAYALVYEENKPLSARLKALLPFVAIVLAWRLTYTHLGFGSMGSGGYIDPVADPLRFAQTMLLRLPALLVAQLYSVSSSIFHLQAYPVQRVYAAVATLAVLLTVLAARRFGLWASPLARFYGLGSVLALVPVCAAETNDRLLLNAEIGLSALLAMLFVAMARNHRLYTGLAALGAKALVAVLMFVHLLAFPVMTLASSTLMHKVVRFAAHDEPLSVPDAGPGSNEQVILVNPPKALFAGYYPVVRRYFGVHNPASMQSLASGDQPLSLSVLDERTLRMSGERGFGEAVSRDFLKYPFKVGDVIHAGHFTVTVEAVTPLGKASQVRFDFDTPLTAAPWRMYAWVDSGYQPFRLPAPGQSVVLPAVDVGKLASRQLRNAVSDTWRDTRRALHLGGTSTASAADESLWPPKVFSSLQPLSASKSKP